MKLSGKIQRLFENIEGIISENPYFTPLINELSDMRARLDTPLRVAVVGMVKAGKSTLLNALLGEKILFTDVLEATLTACWFKYGEKRKLTVHFSDGTEEEKPFDEIEKWSSWKGQRGNGELLSRKWLIITYPSALLKTMDIIDTAGLNAATAETPEEAIDVQNTLDLLEHAGIEAFIYAYQHTFQKQDLDILKKYNSSPLNAIGLLTRIDDQHWKPLFPDVSPFDKVADMCVNHSREYHDIFYKVTPAAAIIAEGAARLSGEVIDNLRQLSETEPKMLRNALMDSGKFKYNEQLEGISLSAADREKILDMFARYGVYTLAKALREDPDADIYKLAYEISGVNEVRQIILRHFGNHAYLIRLENIVRRVEKLISAIRRVNRDDESITRICSLLRTKVEEWETQEESLFMELEVLRSYYNGEFEIEDGTLKEQFLQITGEYGGSCEARLGFSGKVTVAELAQEAWNRLEIWRQYANRYGALTKAAEIIMKLCNEMYTRLDELTGYDAMHFEQK